MLDQSVSSTGSTASTNKVVLAVASGQSTHLPDKGILCEIFKQTGSCPVASCPYAHIPASSRRRLPNMVCHYYVNARCLRENCHYFHGPRRLFDQLKANGVAEFTPADFMPVRNPLAELTPQEVGTPASKIALAMFGLSAESEQARPRSNAASNSSVPAPPYKFPVAAGSRDAASSSSSSPSLPPPPPYPGTAFQPIGVVPPPPPPPGHQPAMMWAAPHPMMMPAGAVMGAPPHYIVPAGPWPGVPMPHAMMFGGAQPMFIPTAVAPPMFDLSAQQQQQQNNANAGAATVFS